MMTPHEEVIDIIAPSMDEETENTTKQQQLKTTHAKAIAKIFGNCTPDLVLFDTCRQQIKAQRQASKKPPQSIQNQHERLLAKFQTLILVKKSERQKITGWETNFYAKNALPRLDEDIEYQGLIKERNAIRNLLCKWKITLD